MGDESPEVEYQIVERVAWIAMNRPHVLNALSETMFRGLTQGLEAAARSDVARSIVITGRGKAFSAGLDIKQVASFPSQSDAKAFVYGLVKPFWDTFLRCDKPLVSVVNGVAYGAGAEIALMSDIVIASTGSTFAFSGGRVGALCCISAAVGPLLMGGRRVVEMNLTGEPLTAVEAHTLGLVNYVVPDTRLLAVTGRVLKKLSQVSPISNSSFKRILRSTIPRASLAAAYKELLNTITSPDFRKGARAFAHKMAPDYNT